MRYREFVLSPYGVIKIKSLGYIANRLKNDYILCPDMRQRSIAGCYQNNVAWLYHCWAGWVTACVSCACKWACPSNGDRFWRPY
ncbi:hypothetical protein [Symbiopectobacterium purcellii]|uniref:hypothetical protein n=1 Tax=Symbiopectobacterium purcellii TaxID=2871826 RepID=UPI003F85EB24